MIHDTTESLKALPNIFVSREGHQVDGGEVSVHRYQIQTQKNSQNLNNEPHQRRAGLNAQDLWRKPEHKDREKSLTSENKCVCLLVPASVDIFMVRNVIYFG